MEPVMSEVNKVKEMLQEMRQGQQAEQSFSGVSSTCAEKLLGAIGVTEVNGNEEDPIVVPPGAPLCEDFDYSKYQNENAGTPDLMEHHKTQLAKFGIPFCRGGYAMYDLHSKGICFRFSVNGQVYHGTTDCCLAPSGLLGVSPCQLLRIGFEHKKPKTMQESVSFAFALSSCALLLIL